MIDVNNERRRKRTLFALVLLGFALRVYHLDTMSFWADEVLTPLRSALSLRQIVSNYVTIQGVVSQDTHPPFYFLIIHFTRQLLGTSDFAYRFIAVAFGTLTIPMVARFSRALFGPAIALVAAALTAINPLQIWYAQEARMYTLLVFCMLVASHALWRLWQESDVRQMPRWIVAYALFASVAFFTHYTATFLILTQGVLLLWILWSKEQPKLLLGVVVTSLLLGLPVARFIVPRLFTGAEASYSLVPPQVFFLDVVRGFGFGRTADYTQPAIYTLWVLLTLILLIGVRYAQQAQRRFLLVYMLSATLGLLIGSYALKPMYLGPHHMMVGSPAFIVLIAVAVVRIRPKPLLPVVALIILATQWTSLDNLYTNPTFAKDNYRDLVHYIDSQATVRDLVIYNNATLTPMQTHYSQRDDLPYITLPAYTTFATQETQDGLAATTAERIWFMSAPPQYPGDEDGLVRAVLEEKFFVTDRRWFHGNNTEMLISAFAPRLVGEPLETATRTDWRGAQLPQLVAQQLFRGRDTVWADLWWQLDQEDITAFVPLHYELRAPDGAVWRQGVWEFWSAEDSAELAPQLPSAATIHTSYALQLPPALPPGVYQLWVRSAAASDGWHTLGDIPIEYAPTPEFDTRGMLRFANGLELAGIDLAETSVHPGNGLPLVAYWRVTEPLTQSPQLQLRVNGPDGLIHDETTDIFPSWLPPEQLPLGTLIAKPIGLFPAANVQNGVYELLWSVKSAEQIISGKPPLRPWQTAVNRLGQFNITPFPLVTELSTGVDKPVDNHFAGAITLAGYELDAETAAAGETLTLSLYWESLATLPDDYWVFAHVSAEVDQPPQTTSNSVPVGSTRPTSGWRIGEILHDERTLTLPIDLPDGTYTLLIGLYHPETGQRLPVTSGGETLPLDQFPLTTIIVK